MPGQPVAEAESDVRTYRDRQIDPGRTSADCVTCGGGLSRVEPRVVDAGADIRTKPLRLVKETVCEQERRSEPARGGDDLSVEGHGAELGGPFALRLGQWRDADRKLDTEVAGEPADIREVRRDHILDLQVGTRRYVGPPDIVRLRVIHDVVGTDSQRVGQSVLLRPCAYRYRGCQYPEGNRQDPCKHDWLPLTSEPTEEAA